jgi:hypothetical protein
VVEVVDVDVVDVEVEELVEIVELEVLVELEGGAPAGPQSGRSSMLELFVRRVWALPSSLMT